jgi:hypothetical protein
MFRLFSGIGQTMGPMAFENGSVRAECQRRWPFLGLFQKAQTGLVA